jgi:hypothetical protein
VTIVNVQGEQAADEHQQDPLGVVQFVADAVAGARVGGEFATPRWWAVVLRGACRGAAFGVVIAGSRLRRQLEDVGIVFE